jgi:hypothetical protein
MPCGLRGKYLPKHAPATHHHPSLGRKTPTSPACQQVLRNALHGKTRTQSVG